MKNKLTMTNFAISVMGVLSLFFTFVKIFLEEYDYNLPVIILMIILICFVMSVINVRIKHAWAVNLGLLVLALIYLWFFRHEIIGGYMEFYNVIIDIYANKFMTAMYFATPKGKWLTDSDVTLMVGFSIVVLSIIYTLLISRKKLIAIPLTVNMFLLAVPLVVDMVPPIIFVILDFVFIIEMFVMTGISKNGSDNESSISHIQTTSLVIGAIIMAVCLIINLIVPQSRYVKSPYFDKVGDFAVNVYDKIEQKIISIAGKGEGGNASIDGDGKSVIENEKLGQIDGINYLYKEMIQADVPAYADLVYIKQFIGKNYANNSWNEISKDDTVEIDELLRAYNSSAQEMTSTLIDERMLLAESGTVFKNRMSIRYTGMQRSHQLMPLYSFTEENKYFDYESYYNEIEEDIYFEYFDVDLNAVESMIVRDNYSEQAYRKYVYENYLQTGFKCEKQFKELLKTFKTDTYSDVMLLAEYIRQHLMERCTYTLTPGRIPSGEDFVDYFYNTSKKGYCTYFATTAVMMLRSKGVPARYVTGFFFRPDENVIDNFEAFGKEMNRVSVDDSHAHAWIEFYIDGFGWVEFDVTPGNFDKMDVEIPKEEATTSPVDETTKETESTPEKSTGTRPDTTTKAKENIPVEKVTLSKTAIKNIICIITVILTAAVILSFILIRYRVRNTKQRLDYEECRKADKKSCIKTNYERMDKILGFAGFVRPKDMTYKTYAEKLINECSFIEPEKIKIITDLYEKAEFSCNDITDDEINQSEHIVDEICNRVYTDIGFLKKLRFKYFCNLI